MSARRSIAQAALYSSGVCHEAVSREGELQPCDEPAIALRRSEPELGEGYADPYPVCAYHAGVGKCVTLMQLVDAVLGRIE